MSSSIIIQLIYRLIFIGLEPPCGKSLDCGIYWLAHTSNHLGKSATIREWNPGSGVCKEHCYIPYECLL